VAAIFWCKHADEYIFDVSGPEGCSARHSEITEIFLKVCVYAALLAIVFFIAMMAVVLSKHSLLHLAEYIHID
jgi:hypothetical protein